MRSLFIIGIVLFASCSTKNEVKLVAEISCGQCQFDLKEGGCDLAVRFDNKAYFVDGFGIDDFGDAHDENTGFCNVLRKGDITGKIVNNKFLASQIKLSD